MAAVYHKNLLQEYCQKRKLAIPQYNTRNVEGTDETYAVYPYVWMSTVTLSLPGDPFGKYTGGIEKTKVEAEQSAAGLALSFLQQSEASQPKLTTKTSTAIFIDGENCPKAYEPLFKELGDGYTMCTFASTGHPASLRESLGSSDILLTVPSSRKDAVDIAMAIHLGVCIERNFMRRYIIITKDHFGACIPECLNGYAGNRQVLHYLSASDFLVAERCS